MNTTKGTINKIKNNHHNEAVETSSGWSADWPDSLTFSKVIINAITNVINNNNNCISIYLVESNSSCCKAYSEAVVISSIGVRA